ncbi:hypothetical protein L1987_47015 [Smallanthus sonchifolius]|uniref:Uncharacterized protein n=1 Tax=Smallanthus sonchifolius TaxID=185202 RepID=A0ACB9G187_9ASTR|nr:hypothetical protein L1987_47015 [Smallanthus sonchifolius]
MVFRWRRAFCTSVPPEPDSGSTRDEHEHGTDGKGNGTGGVFSSSSSNPSTPRLPSPSLRCRTTSATIPAKSASVPVSPRCKSSNSPGLFQCSSTPSSPRSPSAFSIFRSNLRISTKRCGLCLHSVKRGRGVAIFTAECSHRFHFPCIAGYVKKKGSLACPTCGSMWRDMPLLCVNDQKQKHQFDEEDERPREKLVATVMDEVVEKKKAVMKKQNSFMPDLRVYNDDEPLASLTPKARFNPIPESDESCDEDSIGEFQGFHSDGCGNNVVDIHTRDVDVRLLPEVALISAGRSYETHAIILRARAPATPEKTHRRAPIDVVTVVDVSAKMSNEKLQTMKRTMRIIISSLSTSDRLSIVAFSSYSKRLLHLKRMTNTGKRAASHIVEAMAVVDGSSNATVAVKKAAKVLEDRREKNTVASIILLSDVADQSSYVSSTRYINHQSHLNVAVHTLKLTAIDNHALAKTVGSLLNVAVQDLQLRLGFVSGSAPAEIAAVYTHAPPSIALCSSTVLIGELYANEEREMLIELKVPSPAGRAYQVLSVRCSYRESVTQDVIYCNEHALVIPRPHTVRSSTLTIQRLRCLFITTRALAESRRLSARNDLIGAYHMLISARTTMQATSLDSSEFVVRLEAELGELQRRRQAQAQTMRGKGETAAYMDENCEPLTPTSAWRVAEKLANVAIIKKSLNRVSDLHGFEDARF